MTDTDERSPADTPTTAGPNRALTIVRGMLGRRSDWRLVRPTPSVPHPTVGWIGTALVVASVALSWLAFDSATVHTEDFDIRQGFGPDLSKPIDTWTRRRLASRTNPT